MSGFLSLLAESERVVFLVSRRKSEPWISVPQGRLWAILVPKLSSSEANRLAMTVNPGYIANEPSAVERLDRIIAAFDYNPLAIEVIISAMNDAGEEPRHFLERTRLEGVLPVAADEMHERLRSINDFEQKIIQNLARKEMDGDEESKVMLCMLMIFSPFHRFLPQVLDRYIGFCLMRNVYVKSK